MMAKIRKCTTEDITAAGDFYDRVVEHLDAHINYPKWKYKEYPSEKYASSMTAAGFQYICVEDERIVGAFVLNTDPEGEYQKGIWSRKLSDGEYMVIHALAVDPELSGTGIGKELVSFCIETAKQSGFKAIRLDIVPNNTPAQHLYEGFGFSCAGEADVRPDIEDIPRFRLYELNFDK